MAIKYQFNKTSLTSLGKQLKVREKALPTLKNKESALRMEVKRAKQRSDELLEELDKSLSSYRNMAALWNEFTPGLITVKDVELETVKIAGIKTPALREVLFDVRPYSLFSEPQWYAQGTDPKDLAQIGIRARSSWKRKICLILHVKKRLKSKSVRKSTDPGIPGSDQKDQTFHGR